MPQCPTAGNANEIDVELSCVAINGYNNVA